MKLRSIQMMLVAFVVTALGALLADCTRAQCATCPAPTIAYHTVAYQPAQPAVAYRPYYGWYPGKLIDRWRSRGLTVAAPATYAAAYAPYSAGYASYVTGYAPQRAAYAPYLTAYAPLTPACNTCTQTVARPIVLRAVVTSGCATCGCEPCGCSTCSSGVGQAVYTEPACSSCAGGTSFATSSGETYAGERTDLPYLPPDPAAGGSSHRAKRIPESGADQDQTGAGELGQEKPDPAPEDDSGARSKFYFGVPPLEEPSDRTAARRADSRGPTVDVWKAVYRKPVHSSMKRVSQTRSQAGIDAEGWSAVPPGR